MQFAVLSYCFKSFCFVLLQKCTNENSAVAVALLQQSDVAVVSFWVGNLFCTYGRNTSVVSGVARDGRMDDTCAGIPAIPWAPAEMLRLCRCREIHNTLGVGRDTERSSSPAPLLLWKVLRAFILLLFIAFKPGNQSRCHEDHACCVKTHGLAMGTEGAHV